MHISFLLKDMHIEIEPTRFINCKQQTLSRRNKNLVRLWSFQPWSVWLKLQELKTMYVDPAYIDRDFIPDYNWMIQQLKVRLPNYQGHFPWWAYYNNKPDLRSWRYYFPNGHAVCLELQLPSERVLLSDYETWHCVLSGQYLALNKTEDEAWEAQYYSNSASSEPWKEVITQSWERIFDVESLRGGGLWPAMTLQACFEELNWSDIISVIELRSR